MSKTYPPQRRTRKRDKNFVAIPFSNTLTLGALTMNTVLVGNLFGAVFGEDIYIISVDWNSAAQNHTAGEGAFELGFSHSDLSVAEVAEALDAELTDPDDIIAKEHSRRPVRRAGLYAGLLAEESLNQGVNKRTKIKFSVGDGHNLNLFSRNRSGATFTTGTLIRTQGTLYGRWQR